MKQSNQENEINIVYNGREYKVRLLATIRFNQIIPINSEKSCSELLIIPILIEWLNRNPKKLQYFSDNTFDVIPEKALNGHYTYGAVINGVVWFMSE